MKKKTPIQIKMINRKGRKKPGGLGAYVLKKLLIKNKLIEKLLLKFICIRVQGEKRSSGLFKTCIFIGNNLLTTYLHKPITHILLVLHFKMQET